MIRGPFELVKTRPSEYQAANAGRFLPVRPNELARSFLTDGITPESKWQERLRDRIRAYLHGSAL